MRHRFFPPVVGLGPGRISFFCVAATVVVVSEADELGALDGGRDGGGVVGDGDGDGFIILTC